VITMSLSPRSPCPSARPGRRPSPPPAACRQPAACAGPPLRDPSCTPAPPAARPASASPGQQKVHEVQSELQLQRCACVSYAYPLITPVTHPCWMQTALFPPGFLQPQDVITRGMQVEYGGGMSCSLLSCSAKFGLCSTQCWHLVCAVREHQPHVRAVDLAVGAGLLGRLRRRIAAPALV
jgi:hypothetical protein